MQAIQDNHNVLPIQVVFMLLGSIDSATKFLTGSTSKRIPYEIVYTLERALLDGWESHTPLITTAIGSGIRESFYFQGVPELFGDLVENILGKKLPRNLVQISLPQAYRHKPLYIVPLYHELGHYIDKVNRVVETSLLIVGGSLILRSARWGTKPLSDFCPQ